MGHVQWGHIENPLQLLEIQTADGRVWAPSQDCVTVPAVGYVLMYDQQVVATEHVTVAYVQGVCQQLEDDVLAGSRNIAAIMKNIATEEPVDPMLPIPIVHPITGVVQQATPRHVVDWVFASRRSNILPMNTPVGATVWDDPRHPVEDSDDSNDEDEDFPIPQAVSPPRPVNLTTRAVKRTAVYGQNQPPALRVCQSPLQIDLKHQLLLPDTKANELLPDLLPPGWSSEVPPPATNPELTTPGHRPLLPALHPQVAHYAAAPYRFAAPSHPQSQATPAHPGPQPTCSQPLVRRGDLAQSTAMTLGLIPHSLEALMPAFHAHGCCYHPLNLRQEKGLQPATGRSRGRYHLVKCCDSPTGRHDGGLTSGHCADHQMEKAPWNCCLPLDGAFWHWTVICSTFPSLVERRT